MNTSDGNETQAFVSDLSTDTSGQLITDEEFRAVGFTGAARNFPRDELALVMLAAFNGVRPDQLTPAMRYFPNEATKRAWTNVAAAAEAFLAERASK